MTATTPVYRTYNNVYPKESGKNPWDFNHRYSTDRSVMDGMIAQGWRDKGIVLCAPLNE